MIDRTPSVLRRSPASEPGRRALHDLAKLVIEAYRRAAPGGEMPQRVEHRSVFDDPSPGVPGQVRQFGWSETFVVKGNLGRLRVPSQAAWLSDPAIRSTLQKLWDAGDAPRVQVSGIPNPTFDQAAPAVFDRVIEVIRRYLEEAGSFEFDAQGLENAYMAFRYYELVDEALYLVMVPIFGFHSETLPIPLEQNVVIETFKGEDKTALWVGEMVSGYATRQEWIECQSALHVRHTKPVGGDPHHGELALQATIKRALTALRLTGHGSITAPAQFRRLLTPFPGEGGQASNLDDWGSRQQHVSQFVLTAAEIPDLRGMYSKLKRVETNKDYSRLNLAIRRLNQTYSRSSREDRIVDLTIALESSLLLGSKDELKLRFALRGAALLRNETDPHQTVQFLKDLYDIRSSVVHEGRTLEEMATDKSLKKLFRKVAHPDVDREARRYTRLVIRALIDVLDGGGTLLDVPSGLETLIVDSMKPVTGTARPEG